jgi:SagB-type dehydrogenase family enzyme
MSVYITIMQPSTPSLCTVGVHLRADLARAALSQEFISEAPLVIAICASFGRTTRGYGRRGERYVYIEVGHAGQNIYLQVVALGLATVAIGAFRDEAVREALKMDAECHPLYLKPVWANRLKDS